VSTKEITGVFTTFALPLLCFIAVAVLGIVYWTFGIYAMAWLVVYATAVLVIFGITDLVLGIRRLSKRLASSDIGFLDKQISTLSLDKTQDPAQLAAAIAQVLGEDTEHRPN